MSRKRDETDLDMLRALQAGAPLTDAARAAGLPPAEALRRLHMIRAADERHDPAAPTFWAAHPLTRQGDPDAHHG